VSSQIETVFVPRLVHQSRSSTWISPFPSSCARSWCNHPGHGLETRWRPRSRARGPVAQIDQTRRLPRPYLSLPSSSPCIYTPRARHTRQGTASPADLFSSSPSSKRLASSSRRLSASRWQVTSRRLQRRRRRWRHRREAAAGGSTGRPSTAESPTSSWSRRSSPPTRSTRAVASPAQQSSPRGGKASVSSEFPLTPNFSSASSYSSMEVEASV
jgi:hypothetical protein